ncbi:MAG TPA: protein phosphatase 2C domain-containing protein [Bryobacteraceae bacterium]|nr:protein phosphatase 2C domain-containing protein [Bryobacteraceae bacterium]
MSTLAAFRCAMATDIGGRTRNEDRVYIDEANGIFLVVDGVGGHAAGDRAAELAVKVIARELAVSNGSAERRIRRAIAAANNDIFEAAETTDECRGMACVLTLAIADGDRVTTGHVGDSRLYLVWNGRVRKLTSDHSPIGEQEDNGEITEREAMRHPRRNEVFRDVGTQIHGPDDEDFIEIRSFLFHPDAALLLCTDGLTDALTSAEISAVVESYDGDPEHTVQSLLAAANAAGAADNVSAIFIAGPEFIGVASPRMAEARLRHATTRMRGSAWRRFWLTRFPWLFAGLVAGMAGWAALERITPGLLQTTPPPPKPARTIIVRPDDPAAFGRALAVAHAGDTIVVPPGQYAGRLEFRDGVVVVTRSPEK